MTLHSRFAIIMVDLLKAIEIYNLYVKEGVENESNTHN